MDHTHHKPLAAAEINASNLTDAVIYGPNDEKIGTVAHVHGMGATMQAIVDVGGFLGIGTKSVALEVSDLNFMRDENGKVHAVTSWTKDQVKDLPEHHH
ncbi:MAG: PRC-barrel domain containing protein [Paracoccaceae bacterium]